MPKILKNEQLIKKKESLSLKKFNDVKNKILFVHEHGGLGDILMHRMIFKQIKKIIPDSIITFACPDIYHEAVSDHPFIDEVISLSSVNECDHGISYNTTHRCARYEASIAPHSDKHRSDIWADQCGIEIDDHDMCIQLEDEYREKAINKISALKENHTGPVVCLCPKSARNELKSLLDWQLEIVVNYLREKGCWVYYLHTSNIPDLDKLNVSGIHGISIREWMGFIDTSDYIISVDTSAFHFASNQKKPLVGVFTYCDGKVYGKYADFILIQKHRDNGDWDCGPCYKWIDCPFAKKGPRPCLTKISSDMLKKGIDEMFDKWKL